MQTPETLSLIKATSIIDSSLFGAEELYGYVYRNRVKRYLELDPETKFYVSDLYQFNRPKIYASFKINDGRRYLKEITISTSLSNGDMIGTILAPVNNISTKFKKVDTEIRFPKTNEGRRKALIYNELNPYHFIQ